ncbi:hypothetical protein [Conexibacter sp. SYSU D00693]|uniref:hypothetical protein n=1 Tax=Conexibacter sp. SYSU D00693 TaxID=2812560 RepID=UPI00196A9383|nr:hypothetical protein [Conexibacter sp. SYSU D00693]
MRRPDLPTLVAALAVMALGTVLLLDQVGELTLDFSTASPSVLVTVGVVLVAAGMARRDMRG